MLSDDGLPVGSRQRIRAKQPSSFRQHSELCQRSAGVGTLRRSRLPNHQQNSELHLARARTQRIRAKETVELPAAQRLRPVWMKAGSCALKAQPPAGPLTEQGAIPGTFARIRAMLAPARCLLPVFYGNECAG
ncbi:hypothetical protein [Paenibacillus agricola]|uniref:Uncharacterized protein n=1 Tax=Paenibacillus agricola TaxID=2716264 RepID=A0ABX0JAH6_9BACL|nr:hypothetical protein [Paenibacillus agricola]NHN33152.1 hypothetical protein [Paenibacillus agricola]